MARPKSVFSASLAASARADIVELLDHHEIPHKLQATVAASSFPLETMMNVFLETMQKALNGCDCLLVLEHKRAGHNTSRSACSSKHRACLSASVLTRTQSHKTALAMAETAQPPQPVPLKP